jgi:hypothetical protein
VHDDEQLIGTLVSALETCAVELLRLSLSAPDARVHAAIDKARAALRAYDLVTYPPRLKQKQSTTEETT